MTFTFVLEQVGDCWVLFKYKGKYDSVFVCVEKNYLVELQPFNEGLQLFERLQPLIEWVHCFQRLQPFVEWVQLTLMNRHNFSRRGMISLFMKS